MIKVEWETDGAFVDLPDTVSCPSDMPDEYVSSWLSDTFGWLVLFWEPIKEDDLITEEYEFPIEPPMDHTHTETFWNQLDKESA
jgi:hypothetical protein